MHAPRPRLRCCAAPWLALLLLAVAGPARGQIVNVQPLVGAGPRLGISQSLEATVDWRTGNTSLLQIAGSSVTQLRHGRSLWFLMLHGEYGEKGGGNFINEDLEHLRYRFTLPGPVELESFAQHERDEFRRLSLRMLWGAGPRVRALSHRVVTITAGVAYMLEYEKLSGGTEPDANEGRLNHRLSSYVVVTVQAAPRLFLSQTVYAQPRFDRFQDARFLADSDLLAVATRHVGVKLTFSLSYDTEPAVNVHARNTTLKAALLFSF